jgi:hypothetical protein
MDWEIGWPHPIPVYNNQIQYQTGALTSRPYFKGLIRGSNSFLRGAEILYSLARASVHPQLWKQNKGELLFNDLMTARRARAVVQVPILSLWRLSEEAS